MKLIKMANVECPTCKRTDAMYTDDYNTNSASCMECTITYVLIWDRGTFPTWTPGSGYEPYALVNRNKAYVEAEDESE